MSIINLTEIYCNNNAIVFQYEVSEDLKRFFKLDEVFEIEYTLNDESVSLEKVPKSVLAIPFVCNVLPIAWLTDAELIVPELDEDFYNSIPEFKKGYVEMYPNLQFDGNVTVQNLQSNQCTNTGRSATFFSGGLDAWCTLVRHIEEKPDLISLWGADIPYNYVEGWNVHKNTLSNTAKMLELPLIIVRSSFREFINEKELNKRFRALMNDGWWHAMQHGIGLIGHAAPYNFLRGISKQYIAASYSPEDSNFNCASSPTIDNYVRFFGCSISHDAYITRQEKIQIVSEYHGCTKTPINLHVCWKTTTGFNCCECEKCARTLVGFISEGENYAEYGFEPSKINLDEIKRLIREEFEFDHTSGAWNQIKRAYLKNESKLQGNADFRSIAWIKSYNFDQPNKNWCRRKKHIKYVLQNPREVLAAKFPYLYSFYKNRLKDKGSI